MQGGTLPAIAVIAHGPASYTGDDVVELLVPGGDAGLAHLQETLIQEAEARAVALRQAEPGEFTARAYLNGRIDLLEAEGIAEAIRAESDSHLRAARLMSDGGLGSVALELVDSLTHLTAMVEAGIDFTDQEDVVAIANDALEARLADLVAGLDRRLEGTTSIERIESVPRVVLAGPANAGKSSLFNALLGSERTVVTAVEGTTRDVVTESLLLETPDGDLEILLSDVAGFEAVNEGTDPRIARAMQAGAREAVERADLVVRCTAPGQELASLAEGIPVLDVATKGDLSPVGVSGHVVSVVDGTGVRELADLIADRLGARSNVLGSGMLALTHRHRTVLDRSMDAMVRARMLVLEAGEGVMPPAELIAACLRDGLDALGELVGRVTPDQVLEHVFARFCIGK